MSGATIGNRSMDKGERLYRVKAILNLHPLDMERLLKSLPLLERCSLEVDIRDYQNYKSVFD